VELALLAAGRVVLRLRFAGVAWRLLVLPTDVMAVARVATAGNGLA
jgi:hypothetical protein